MKITFLLPADKFPTDFPYGPDLDNLPDPDVLALEIVENIEAGLPSFKEIVEGLNGNGKG